MVEQAHSGKARLGDLRRADRVVDSRCLAAPRGVERQLALAKVHEIGFPAIARAEIEMAAMTLFEEARRAKILVLANPIDISPEGAGALGNIVTRQISAARRQRRGERAIDADQPAVGAGGRFPDPVKHRAARPDAVGRYQHWRIPPRRAPGNGDALVTPAFPARPVARGEQGEPPPPWPA